jgi:hypothetical protein
VEDFHGSRIAALHLREAARSGTAFKQQDLHAAAGKIQRKRGPDRTGARDDDIGVLQECLLWILPGNTILLEGDGRARRRSGIGRERQISAALF